MQNNSKSQVTNKFQTSSTRPALNGFKLQQLVVKGREDTLALLSNSEAMSRGNNAPNSDDYPRFELSARPMFGVSPATVRLILW